MVEPANWTLVFKLFSKGDQLKLKLISLKLPKTKKWASFYYLGEVCY